MKKERNMDRKYRFVSGSSSAIGRETRNPETRFGTCLIPVHCSLGGGHRWHEAWGGCRPENTKSEIVHFLILTTTFVHNDGSELRRAIVVGRFEE